MNTKHLLTASLAGGLVSLVLTNTPVVYLVNLLLCAGFWFGPVVAVWLYRRSSGSIRLNQALLVGLVAGAWHGLFGMLLSPLGLAGAGSIVGQASRIMTPEDLQGLQAGMTGLGGFVFNLLGVLIDLVFGLLGGVIGGALFRTGSTTAT